MTQPPDRAPAFAAAHRRLFITVIVCAHNEARYLATGLYSLLAQTRPPDEILVIVNASTDETRAVAQQVPSVRVVDEPRKGLVVARETGRRVATGDLLVYLDADCRAPLLWLERIECRFLRDARTVALSGPYRYDDRDRWGDFHKPKHLYPWKTLIRSEKNWPALKHALRTNTDVALMLYRNGSWLAARGAA